MRVETLFSAWFLVESAIRTEFYDLDYFDISTALETGKYNKTTVHRILMVKRR